MTTKKPNTSRFLQTLFRNNKEFCKELPFQAGIYFFTAMIIATIPIASIALYAKGVEMISTGEVLTKTALITASLLFSIEAITYILNAIQQTIRFTISYTASATTYTKVTKALLNLDVASHESKKIKDKIQNIFNRGPYILFHLIQNQTYVLQNCITATIALVTLSAINLTTTVIILTAIIPNIFINKKLAAYRYKEMRKVNNFRRPLMAQARWTQDEATIPEIKIFQNEQHLKKILEKGYHQAANMEAKVDIHDLKIKIITYILSAIAIFAAVFYILKTNHQTPIAEIIFAIGLLYQSQKSLTEASMQLGQLQERILVLRDIHEIVDHIPQITDKADAKKLEAETPSIEFNNVSFAYPNTKKNILKNLSFKINPGEKVAIIGENGAGKTTLIKLLCRFYDPTKGEVLINNTPLTELKKDSWFEKLSVLFQDFMQARSITIAEKIHLGNPHKEFSREQALTAAKKSTAQNIIKDLEHGFETMLGKSFNGIELSGGQWQKLSLTKAHYKDPQVIILDEPTSAMDPKAEKQVFDAIHKLKGKVTAIFISHRITTILEADKIIHMKNGRVTHIGTHKELLKTDKEYRELFQEQMNKMQNA